MARVKQTGGRVGRKGNKYRIKQMLPKLIASKAPAPKKPKKSSRRGRQSGVGTSRGGLSTLFRRLFDSGAYFRQGGTLPSGNRPGSKFYRGKGRTKSKRTSRGKNRAANTGRLSGVGPSKPRTATRPKARGLKKPARTYRKPKK